MLSLSNRVGSAVALSILSGTLGGCVTGTEALYQEYQYNHSGGTDQELEHTIYSDPTNAAESETCRSIVKRRVSEWESNAATYGRVCHPSPRATTGEPWFRQAAPQSIGPDSVEPSPPPADIPDLNDMEGDPG